MISKKAMGALMLRICTEQSLRIEKVVLFHLAHHVTEALNNADMIRKKLSSVELARKSIQQQLERHNEEEESLRQQCSHLHISGEIETGGDTVYKCSICGSDILP